MSVAHELRHVFINERLIFARYFIHEHPSLRNFIFKIIVLHVLWYATNYTLKLNHLCE